tara:strand:+ start:614 stop:1021 length:408 start_codon:yes stop_codon:yes gene_type:complete
MNKVGGIKGIRQITRRIKGSNVIMNNRDKLAQELVSLGTSDITDIMTWDDQGNVEIKASKDIKPDALRSIRKIRVLPGQGIEVELIDKVRVLQTLAKSAGLLESEKHADRPAVVEVQMLGPGDNTFKEKTDEEID